MDGSERSSEGCDSHEDRQVCSLIALSGDIENKYRGKTIDRLGQRIVNPLPVLKGEHVKSIKRGDMYYAYLGKPDGRAQAGYRPVIVLQSDDGNANCSTVIVAAITSNLERYNYPTHVFINTNNTKKPSMALLEQIQTINKDSLREYIGRLGDQNMNAVNKALRISLGL